MFAHSLSQHFPEAGAGLIAALMLTALFLRYMVFAGGALLLVLFFRNRLSGRRIQPVPFTADQFRREASWSFLSMLVFLAVGAVVAALNSQFHFAKLYTSVDGWMGWVWFALSIPAALLVHDFYFYWVHRLMHRPDVYRHLHAVHHASTNPSPLSAFAFHPGEAVLEALGFVVILSVVPMHPLAFLVVSTVMISMNVIGHLGYEIFPAKWADHPVMKYLNTATSHNQHHRTFNYNFGLYTTIWDRLFGTLHPRLAETYERLTRQDTSTIAPSFSERKTS